MNNGAAPLSGSRAIPRTLADSAVELLHEAILNGDFAPGERLPIEDLAARLGMSPMPIREALRELDARGLVEHIPHRGARVAEVSVVDLRETYEVRLSLETMAVRQAALNFTESDAEKAASHLKEWRQAKRGGQAVAARIAHTEFHFTLYEAAGSRWLLRSIRPVWKNGERYRLESVDDRATLDERMREHERILSFCVQHKPDEAAVELHNHLVRTANLMAAKLGGSEPFVLLPAPKA